MEKLERGLYWLLADGGFGRIVYALLAVLCGIAAVSALISGDDTFASIAAVLTVGFVVVLFERD